MQTQSKASMVEHVHQQVIALITQLGLKPGDRLNSESELAGLFSVSRSTVREALRSLQQQGVVVSVQGQGRFISASGSLSVDRPVTKYESITEVLEGRGYAVTSAVLTVEEAAATELEAQALEIAAGSAVIRLLRIRYGDGKPMVISANTVPREVLPGPLDHRDWGGSLTVALAAHGNRVNAALAVITAANLPQDWEQRYNLGSLGPWLRVSEVGLTRAGYRVLFAVDYHCGEEISFSVLRQR